MKYGSLFSGIEAAGVAWRPLGWECAWVAEIDPFACAVLRHHYPHVSNLGDITKVDWHAVDPVDIVVGGPPCQDFSVAGQRAGLEGERGNLSLAYARALDAIDPVWSLTENVPGWLSMADNSFGAFLGHLVGHDAPLVPGRGQRWTDAGVVAGPRRTAAWRICDAQYFGVPQRRRRVFVLAVRGSGNWACAEALFPQQQSVPRNFAPHREAGQGVAPRLTVGAHSSSGHQYRQRGNEDALIPLAFGGNNTSGPIDVATACNAHGGPHGRLDFESETLVAHSLRADGFDAGEDGTGRGTPLVAVPIQSIQAVREKRQNGIGIGQDGDPMFTQTARDQHAVMTLAIQGRGDSHDLEWRQDGIANAVLTPNGGRAGIGVGAVAFDTTQITSPGNVSAPQPGDPCHPLAIAGMLINPPDKYVTQNPDVDTFARPSGAISFDLFNQDARDVALHTLRVSTDNGLQSTPHVQQSGMSVRRLTPVECERLQGFPDDFTLVPHRGKPAADGQRYRAIGNSMAVPVVRWIGQRIQLVEDTITGVADAAD